MIRKVVFPVAGAGTRMLPATKEVAKEILPVIDKPLVQYGVEECVQAGFSDFIFVTSPGKEVFKRYFSPNSELEHFLAEKNKSHLLADLVPLYEKNFVYVYQNVPRGFGHAVLQAQAAVGGEPFAILLPDDLIVADVPVIRQMVDVFERYRLPMIAFQEVPHTEVGRYGIASGRFIEDRLFEIERLVEKPAPKNAPSNYAVIGRYIMTPEIFDLLKLEKAGAGAEIQLTDAVIELMKTKKVLGYLFQGRRFDMGTPAGYVETVIHMALRRPDTRETTRELIRELARNEEL